MARFAHGDRAPVDAAVDRWRQECLIADGSLFSDDQLWTRELADELVARFNDQQLEDARRFEDKLAEQMGPASPQAVRLMAEIVAVYFFFATNVGERRKRELTAFVLSLAEHELPATGDVAEAFKTGIGSAGRAFHSRRPDLLMYLVAFLARFKRLEREARTDLLADAWRFKAWLVAEDGREQMMRHLLLHLLFPDSFERIASGPQKYRIADVFSALVATSPSDDAKVEDEPDVDCRLWAIRQRIAELLPDGQPTIGGAIDFYETPLYEAWDPEEDGEDEEDGISHLGALELKRQVVLHGPPGTGKTWEAKDLARRLLRHQALLRWGPVAFLEHWHLVDSLAEEQVRRLQLHQSYSYEDFIRGMRLTATGATEPVDGYLLELVDEIARQPGQVGPELGPLPWVLILDEVNRVDLSRLLGEAFSCLEDRDSEVDLPMLGAGGIRRALKLPDDLYVIGTMNLIDQSVEQLDFALRRRFLWLQSGFRAEAIVPRVRERWQAQALAAHHPWARLQGDVEMLAERASALNERVRSSPLLGAQYELGHTYFFDIADFIGAWSRVRPRGQRPRRYLWGSDGRPQPPVVDLWRLSLRPLLAEYLAGIEPEAAQEELRTLRSVLLDGRAP